MVYYMTQKKLLSASSYVTETEKGNVSVTLLKRLLIPFKRVLLSGHNYMQKVSTPQIPSHWRIQHQNKNHGMME